MTTTTTHTVTALQATGRKAGRFTFDGKPVTLEVTSAQLEVMLHHGPAWQVLSYSGSCPCSA